MTRLYGFALMLLLLSGFSACVGLQDDPLNYGRVFEASRWTCDSTECWLTLQDGAYSSSDELVIFIEEGGYGSNRWARLPKIEHLGDGQYQILSYSYENFFLDLYVRRTDGGQPQHPGTRRYRFVVANR